MTEAAAIAANETIIAPVNFAPMRRILKSVMSCLMCKAPQKYKFQPRKPSEVLFEYGNLIIFAQMKVCMEEKENRKKDFFIKMVEDKKAIIQGIREGVATKVIEEERDVKFVTPV